jgi:hypothetical protein
MTMFWVIVLSVLGLALLGHSWTGFFNWLANKPQKTIKVPNGEKETLRAFVTTDSK